MPKSTKHIILSFLLLLAGRGFAQQSDSLLTLLNTTKEDTIKVNVYNELFLLNEFENDVKATAYLKQALELAQKIDFKRGLAKAYLFAGFFAEDKGNYSEALTNYQASLKVTESEPNSQKKPIADALMCIGNIYNYQGNYPLTLQSYFKALKIYEEIGFKRGVANSYGNIGSVYAAQESFTEALKDHNAALAIYKELNSKVDMAYSYQNIGSVYLAQRDLKRALKNYQISLQLKTEGGSKTGMASSYNAISAVYTDLAEAEKTPEAQNQMLEQALKNSFSSLKIGNEIGDKASIANSYVNIGGVFIKQKKYKEAREYLNKAKALSEEIGFTYDMKVVYKALMVLDSCVGDFKGAYLNNALFIQYRDSLNSQQTRRKVLESQMNYDFEKKEAVTNAAHKKELENQELLAEEQSHKQNLILLFVLGSLGLVIGFVIFVFKTLKTTRKQKVLIEEQKLVVEEKRKAMIDSITYARRIQQSLLPTEKYIEKNLTRLNNQDDTN